LEKTGVSKSLQEYHPNERISRSFSFEAPFSYLKIFKMKKVRDLKQRIYIRFLPNFLNFYAKPLFLLEE